MTHLTPLEVDARLANLEEALFSNFDSGAANLAFEYFVDTGMKILIEAAPEDRPYVLEQLALIAGVTGLADGMKVDDLFLSANGGQGIH